MKNIFYIFALITLLAACKSKSSPDLESNKDLMILTDPSMNGNYLSDTGVVATAAMRNSTVTPNMNGNTFTKNTRRSGGSNGRVYGSSVSSGGTASSSGTGSNTRTSKKGISKAAKGAIIGGVGGATVGAVIGKNGKGAVIGGVIGAAGGYIIGRKQDKKDGRVQ